MNDLHPDFWAACRFWRDYYRNDAAKLEPGREQAKAAERAQVYGAVVEHVERDGGAGFVYLAQCYGWKGGRE